MKLKLACLALALVAFVTAPLTAKADVVTLELISGATDITIADGGVGDANSAAGVITYIGAVGGWTLNVTTGEGLGIAGLKSMDLNSVDTGATTDSLTIKFKDAGITTPTGSAGYTMAIGGTTATSIAYEVDYNGALLNSIGPFSGGGFSGSTGGTNTFVGPYSLTQIATITGASGINTTSFDANFTIPEPASLSILGAGMLAAAASLRKRLLGRVAS